MSCRKNKIILERDISLHIEIYTEDKFMHIHGVCRNRAEKVKVLPVLMNYQSKSLHVTLILDLQHFLLSFACRDGIKSDQPEGMCL